MASSPSNRSYPPFFLTPITNLSATVADSRPTPISSPTATTTDIPTIDLQNLNGEQLGEACSAWGLFRLANHGVPASLLAQLQAAGQALLALPFEVKKVAFTPPAGYFWGHPALVPSFATVHWVEGVDIPLGKLHQITGPDDETVPGYSSFRCLVGEYGKHMEHITRKLFDTLGLNLKLTSSQLASYLSDSDGILRVHRYPCCTVTSDYFGMNAHTDSSVMSIIDQDEVGGLQILHNGEWHDVTPVPNTFIVVLGDMLQVASGDKYKSPEHRVLANSTKERFSLCYFAFPLQDQVIVGSNYKPFTYKEFSAKVQEDIKETGFKVGLERFRTSK